MFNKIRPSSHVGGSQKIPKKEPSEKQKKVGSVGKQAFQSLKKSSRSLFSRESKKSVLNRHLAKSVFAFIEEKFDGKQMQYAYKLPAIIDQEAEKKIDKIASKQKGTISVTELEGILKGDTQSTGVMAKKIISNLLDQRTKDLLFEVSKLGNPKEIWAKIDQLPRDQVKSLEVLLKHMDSIRDKVKIEKPITSILMPGLKGNEHSAFSLFLGRLAASERMALKRVSAMEEKTSSIGKSVLEGNELDEDIDDVEEGSRSISKEDLNKSFDKAKKKVKKEERTGRGISSDHVNRKTEEARIRAEGKKRRRKEKTQKKKV